MAFSPFRPQPSQAVETFDSAVAACSPDGVLDLLLAFDAQVLAEASPVEDCEAAPEMSLEPILSRLNLTSAHHARIHR
jgi:hypothetical protein